MRKNDPEGDARKVAVLIEALPWLKEFHGNVVVDQVRRQRDGRRRLPARLRRGHGVPAARCGILPGRRARRRPADLRDARPARHPERVPRRPAGHHPESDGRRPDGAGRPGRPRGRRPDQRARPVRRRPVRRGRRAVHRRAARSAIVDGEPVDIGLVGDVVAVDPARCTALLEAGRIPVVSTVAPGRRRRRCTTSTPTPPPPRWPSRCGAEKLVVLTDVEGLYADWPDRDSLVEQIDAARARRDAARRWTPGWSRRWRPACGRCEGGVEARTSSTAGCRTPLLLEMFTDRGHRDDGRPGRSSREATA